MSPRAPPSSVEGYEPPEAPYCAAQAPNSAAQVLFPAAQEPHSDALAPYLAVQSFRVWVLASKGFAVQTLGVQSFVVQSVRVQSFGSRVSRSRVLASRVLVLHLNQPQHNLGPSDGDAPRARHVHFVIPVGAHATVETLSQMWFVKSAPS